MRSRWLDRLLPKAPNPKPKSWLRAAVTGSLYKVSDVRSGSEFATIRSLIDAMRMLAKDSQIATALSYYATDATTANAGGQIIWATPISPEFADVADVINKIFRRLNINSYARDHLIELATIGNLYIPTTELYKDNGQAFYHGSSIALDFNSILDETFDIVPSTKLLPEDVIHLWYHGKPNGYIYQPTDSNDTIIYPECAIIHFSLGGLLGDYRITTKDSDNNDITYDIQFGKPMFEDAALPTQTLGLLEDANVLSSLIHVVRFVNVDCGNTDDETEIMDTLQQIKDSIEQQLSINTSSGDAQSFLNPQSPNNLIYVPKTNGTDPISITDLNLDDTSENDSKLLEYFQNKKLSVLGVPKEMMNFSSAEGLGGAGSVLSQRSAIYANGLQRLMNAYIAGWTQAFNTYFTARKMDGFIDKFVLHMNPIITPLSAVQSERRDAALNQASTLIALLKDLGVSQSSPYLNAIQEILNEALPKTSAEAASWNIDVAEPEGDSNAI